MNNRLNKFTILFAFILFLFSGIVIGYKIKQDKTSVKTNLTQTNKIVVSPTPIIINQGLSYANTELTLINKQNNNSNPTSLIFAIKIPPFHQDWQCSSLGYEEKGFEIYCMQKNCSVVTGNMWGGKLNITQQQICNEELSKREYPRRFNSLTINTSEFESKNEIVDFSTLINKDKLKKTAKGIFYEFNKTNMARYSNSYSATFYSPFKLTDMLSKLTGTFYGSDWIYGKYVIKADVTGDDIEDKVIKLFEKIIDSIVFIKPNNNSGLLNY